MEILSARSRRPIRKEYSFFANRAKRKKRRKLFSMFKHSSRNLSREALAAASVMAVSPVTQAQKKYRRLPFSWVAHASCATDIPFLMSHQEAPPPLHLLATIGKHYSLEPSDVARLLKREQLDPCANTSRLVLSMLLPSSSTSSSVRGARSAWPDLGHSLR